MKKYFFPVFITMMILLVAYVFYALWHSEALAPVPPSPISETKIPEDLSAKKPIPKKDLPKTEVQNRPTQQGANETITPPEMPALPHETKEQMEAHTQEVYDALTPDNYEETMAEAAEAFEEIDQAAEATEEKLSQEMAEVEEFQVQSGENTEEPVEEIEPSEPMMEPIAEMSETSEADQEAEASGKIPQVVETVPAVEEDASPEPEPTYDETVTEEEPETQL